MCPFGNATATQQGATYNSHVHEYTCPATGAINSPVSSLREPYQDFSGAPSSMRMLDPLFPLQETKEVTEARRGSAAPWQMQQMQQLPPTSGTRINHPPNAKEADAAILTCDTYPGHTGVIFQNGGVSFPTTSDNFGNLQGDALSAPQLPPCIQLDESDSTSLLLAPQQNQQQQTQPCQHQRQHFFADDDMQSVTTSSSMPAAPSQGQNIGNATAMHAPFQPIGITWDRNALSLFVKSSLELATSMKIRHEERCSHISDADLQKTHVHNELQSFGFALYSVLVGKPCESPPCTMLRLSSSSATSSLISFNGPTCTSCSVVPSESAPWHYLTRMGIPIALIMLVSALMVSGSGSLYPTARAVEEELRRMNDDPDEYLFDTATSSISTTAARSSASKRARAA